MIYLRLSIVRNSCDQPQHACGSEHGQAEFMFERDDAKACAREAVFLLRREGWRPLAIIDAWEGHTLADCKPCERFMALFREAEARGIVHRLKPLEGTEPADAVLKAG